MKVDVTEQLEIIEEATKTMSVGVLKLIADIVELKNDIAGKDEIIANSELCTRIAEMIDIAEIAKRENKTMEDWIIDTLTSAAMISNHQAIKIDGAVADRFSKLAHARGLAISTLTTGENVTKYIDSGFDNLAY